MPISEPTFFRLLREKNFKDAHALLDSEQVNTGAEAQHITAHLRLAALSREGRYTEALDHIERSVSHFFCKTTAIEEKARILFHLGRMIDARRSIDDAPFDIEADRFPGLINDARFMQCYIYQEIGADAENILNKIPDDFRALVPDESGTHAQHLSVSDLRRRQVSLRNNHQVQTK